MARSGSSILAQSEKSRRSGGRTSRYMAGRCFLPPCEFLPALACHVCVAPGGQLILRILGDPVRSVADRDPAIHLLRRRYREAAVECGHGFAARKCLACSKSPIPRSRISHGSRPCQAPKLRSTRPRADGAQTAILAIPSSCKARPSPASDGSCPPSRPALA